MAVDEIRKAIGAQGGAAAADNVSALELDLSSVESIKKAAAEFRQKVPKLNCLINDAGELLVIKKGDGSGTVPGFNHAAHAIRTS